MGEFKKKKDPNNRNYKAKKYSEKTNFDVKDGKLVEDENGLNDIIAVNSVISSSNDNTTTISIDTEVQEERYDATAISNTTTELGVTEVESYSSIINSAINDYNDALQDYSEYLEGSPTFVTYYRINNRLTTEDTGLNGLTETVGVESPVKYDKILGFPLWNLEEIIPNLEWDEFTGLNTEAEVSAIIIPKTIKPKADDIIVISYLNKKVVFNVTNVSTNNILNQTFYRIQMNIHTHDINYLDSQVVRTYRFDFTAKCLVSDALDGVASKLKSLVVRLMNQYKIQFYVDKYNSFIYDNMYDKYLHRFMEETHLFIMEKTFMFDIHVEPTLLFTVSDNTKYDNSIYERVISLRDKPFITRVNPINILDKSLNNVFSLYRPSIREIDHNSQTGFIPIMSDYTLNLEYSEVLLTPAERVIRIYFNSKGNTDYNSYLSYLDDLVVEYYLKDYIQYPIVIYILKKILATVNNQNSNTTT